MTDPLPNRPDYDLPFPPGTRVVVKTYNGHGYDEAEMDCYADGWPPVVAPADGVVVKTFGCNPGAGFQLSHGDGHYSVYCHVDHAPAVGTRFTRGQVMANVGQFAGMAKHLHWEQLYSTTGTADTDNITKPVIQGQGPLTLVPGDPGLTFITGQRKDWFAMATPEELRAIVRQEIAAAGKTSVASTLPGSLEILLDRVDLNGMRINLVLQAVKALSDPKEFAAQIAAHLPQGTTSPAQIEAAFRKVLLDAGTP